MFHIIIIIKKKRKQVVSVLKTKLKKDWCVYKLKIIHGFSLFFRLTRKHSAQIFTGSLFHVGFLITKLEHYLLTFKQNLEGFSFFVFWLEQRIQISTCSL